MIDQLHAKTFKGLELVLAKELEAIGAENIKPVNRGVNFSGSISMLYKANLYLRTAIRILMPIKQFTAGDEDQLYRKISKIDWSEYMTFKNSFVVDAIAFSDVFRNSHFVEQKVKDAIVDQFRTKTSIRPTIDKKNADIRINVHVTNSFFMISLDSSGESLHKRGYRVEHHRAALNEVLAAGMVLLSNYQGNKPFFNPMCGSGTLGLEAAMIFADIYPGSLDRRYAFQNWQDFDSVLFDRIKENMPPRKELPAEFILTDIDRDAIRMAKANARKLQLDKQIVFKAADFFGEEQCNKPAHIIMNPPYGERLELDNIDEFYASIGNSLKRNYPGSGAWLFTSSLNAVKRVGLKPEKKIVLFNAGLEGRFLKYQLFSGDRKSYLQNKQE